MRVFFHRIVTRLWGWWAARVACRHFCRFLAAGSNFEHCYVHILGRGRFRANSNPHNYTGVGYDHATPGMLETTDPHHCTVSTAGEIGFFHLQDGTSPMPIELQAKALGTVWFHRAPEDGECPEGFFRVRCECRDACMTMDYEAFDAWRNSLEDD